MTKKNKFIIALDGPAGSGKSSICKESCKLEPWTYLTTGILYRLMAYLLHEEKIKFDDLEKLSDFAKTVIPKISWKAKEGTLYYQNKNMMPILLKEETGQLASRYSTLSHIRKILLPLQRDLTFKQTEDVIIVDGRDISTVVFPDANLKIFITSTLKVRSLRRLQQLKKNTDEISLNEMMDKIHSRDEQDKNRSIAPLLQHPEAIVFDTSDLSLKESIESFIRIVKNKLHM